MKDELLKKMLSKEPDEVEISEKVKKDIEPTEAELKEARERIPEFDACEAKLKENFENKQ